MHRPPIAFAAAAMLALAGPVPVLAQDRDAETSRTQPAREEDDSIPWGVLGLLGLAGLLPKKREPDIHVDARHNKR